MAQKFDLRFLLSTKTDRDTQTVRFSAHLVRLEDGKVRNLSDSYGEQAGLANLVVGAQADTDPGRTGSWYGIRPEYRDVFSVNLRQAEAMTKTLRKVKRVFDRDGENMDWVADLETALATVSAALGVKGYIVDAGDNGTGQWGYDGREHRSLSLSEAVAWADAKLAEARPVSA